VPRGLASPDPPLQDDAIRLEPLDQSVAPALLAVLDDPDIVRFTRVPDGADETFVRGWIKRYEDGWQEASRAAFAIRARDDGAFLGWAGIVELDLERGQGELGYLVAPAARGRGVAPRTVELLTRWAFDELGLERLELRIDPENVPSAKVAERAGYRLEGVLRNLHFKAQLRADVGVWSRLRHD
jgi:[ribosomal protein S5]-alanine N-acetyltransferase